MNQKKQAIAFRPQSDAFGKNMGLSSELAQKLIDSLNTAVVLVDEGLGIHYVNQSAEALLGLSLTRAIGRKITQLLILEATDEQDFQLAIRESTPYTKRRARLRVALGHEVVVDYSVTPIEIQNKRSLLLELQDIDRLLKISRDELLVTTHDTTRQLVRGLAHEIKNPLGGIKGAAQLLESELTNPELYEYTRVITDEVDRLRNLVDRLLGPNKLPAKKSMNIHEVLERVIMLLNSETKGDVIIQKDYDPSLPDIVADPEMLIQAFLNIGRNGLQALRESNTPHPELSIQTRIQRRIAIGPVTHRLVCCVDIIDNGPGVLPELVDEIFYPMITSRSEGTGLGLTIAQSVIHEHGGFIECESEPGKTRFSVLLPILDTPENGH